MSEQPETDRKAALKHLGWMVLAAFLLVLFLYPDAFR